LIPPAGWPTTSSGDGGDRRENLFQRRDNLIMAWPPFLFSRDYFGREWAQTMYELTMGTMLITTIVGINIPVHDEFLHTTWLPFIIERFVVRPGIK
jgi:hypothetical protein